MSTHRRHCRHSKQNSASLPKTNMQSFTNLDEGLLVLRFNLGQRLLDFIIVVKYYRRRKNSVQSVLGSQPSGGVEWSALVGGRNFARSVLIIPFFAAPPRLLPLSAWERRTTNGDFELTLSIYLFDISSHRSDEQRRRSIDRSICRSSMSEEQSLDVQHPYHFVVDLVLVLGLKGDVASSTESR